MKKLIIASLMSIASVSAFAGDYYVGASVGHTQLNSVDNTNFASVDKSATGYNFVTGVKVLDNVSVEAGYHNLGKFKVTVGADSADVKGSAFSLAGVVSYPVAQDISVKGSLGVARTEAELDGFSLNKTTPVIGAGVAYQATKDVAVTAGVQHFVKVALTEKSATQFNVGVQYGF